jgi:hypothetical protein
MVERFEVAVKGESPAESQRLVQELMRLMESAAPGTSVERRKESSETMDLGATIAVIISSAAMTAIANGIAAWLAKRQTAQISISRQGGIQAAGLTSADAVRITEIFSESS